MKSKSFSSNIKAWHCFTYLPLKTILPFSLKAKGSNELFRPEVAVVIDAEGSGEFYLLPNSTLFFPGECNDNMCVYNAVAYMWDLDFVTRCGLMCVSLKVSCVCMFFFI